MLCSVAALYLETPMMLWFAAKLVGSVLGCLYPAYITYKAVVRSETDKHQRLLMFWVVNTLLGLVDYLSDPLLSWVPLFYVLKAAAIVYLTVPDFEGSQRVYSFLAKFLNLYEPQIDGFVNNVAVVAERGAATLGEKSRTIAKQTAGDVMNYVATNAGPAIARVQTNVMTQIVAMATPKRPEVPPTPSAPPADEPDSTGTTTSAKPKAA